MVREEYWDKAKEMISFCTDEELKILGQQASKELNKRMNDYLGRFEKAESHSEKVRKRKAKKRAIKRNLK